MRKPQNVLVSSAADGSSSPVPPKALHAPHQPETVDRDSTALQPAEETLIADARAHLTPAQMVEQRLLNLLRRVKGVKFGSELFHQTRRRR